MGTRGKAAYLFGLSSGIAVSIPFIGQSLTVSARIFALIPFISACVFYLISRHEFQFSKKQIAIACLLAIYTCLVLQSSRPEQWSFLFHLTAWRGHSSAYIDSKLLVFFVTATIPLALALLLWTMRDGEEALEGVLAGIACIAALAAAILIYNSHGLFRTDYTTARAWYTNEIGRANFSIISIGILLSMGGVLCVVNLSRSMVRNVLLSITAGLLLLGIIILGRRADTMLFIAAASVIIFSKRIYLSGYLKPALLILLVPTVIFPFATNDLNVMTWANTKRGLDQRIYLANEVIAAESKAIKVAHDSSVQSDAQLPVAKSGKGEAPKRSFEIIFGKGLGAYASQHKGSKFQYPHNLVLETAMESGIIASMVLLLIFALSTVPLIPGLIAGSLSTMTLYASAIATIMFGLALKSGDISMAGPILFFMLLSAGTSAKRSLP